MHKNRLVSLDVFRGAAIAAMILVNNAGADAYIQLKHSPWHGWTFTDTIFPFFLWIIGVAMVFSFKKRLEQGVDKRTLFLHILRRSLILFALCLFLNGFPDFTISTIRIPGVLQRIAVCYFFAGTLFLQTKLRGQILWTTGLLLGYWAVLKLVPVPGFGAGVLEQEGNLAQYIDLGLLKGHMLYARWDPEGIISTIGAVVTVLFGILTGQVLVSRNDPAKKIVWMLAAGAGLVLAGLIMNVWLPINKNLWTSSYAVFMAGLALILFSLFYFAIDLKGYKKWSRPFAIYGMNAITVYIVSVLITKTLMIIDLGGVSLWDVIYTNVYLHFVNPANASLLFALTHVFLLYVVSYAMYRQKLFIKI